MNEEQTRIVDQVYNQIDDALNVLMQPAMNTVSRIDVVREAIFRGLISVNALTPGSPLVSTDILAIRS
jgi:hypothetical protein